MSVALDKLARGQEDKVDLSDVMCPICLSILIEPVRMPCQHVLCMPCFQENVNQASLSCPICRTRISNWCRRAVKSNSLVCQELWDFMKERFTVRVESRLAGKDDTDADELFPCLPTHNFAQTGDIKMEFEAVIRKEEEERTRRRQEEEKESKDLINRLEEEEQADWEEKQRMTLEDQKLAEQLNNTPSPGKENRFTPNNKLVRKKTPSGPMDAYLLTPHGKSQKANERCSSSGSNGSANSIDAELTHFRPIRSAPKSPPKKLADGSLVQPKLIRSKAVPFSSGNIARFLDLQKTNNESIDICSMDTVLMDSQSQSLLAPTEEQKQPSKRNIRPLSPVDDVPAESQGMAQRSPDIFSGSQDLFTTVPDTQEGDFDTQQLIDIIGQEDAETELKVKEELLKQQRQIEEQFEMEKKDAEFARKIQKEMDQEQRLVNRRKGSDDEYQLRPKSASKTPPLSNRKTPKISRSGGSTTKRKSTADGGATPTGSKRQRQMSLVESFQRAPTPGQSGLCQAGPSQMSSQPQESEEF